MGELILLSAAGIAANSVPFPPAGSLFRQFHEVHQRVTEHDDGQSRNQSPDWMVHQSRQRRTILVSFVLITVDAGAVRLGSNNGTGTTYGIQSERLLLCW
jgi:hypothetical protein